MSKFKRNELTKMLTSVGIIFTLGVCRISSDHFLWQFFSDYPIQISNNKSEKTRDKLIKYFYLISLSQQLGEAELSRIEY